MTMKQLFNGVKLAVVAIGAYVIYKDITEG